MSDIKGGNDYGYHTVWYNHNGIDDDGQLPTYTITDMRDMIEILKD